MVQVYPGRDERLRSCIVAGQPRLPCISLHPGGGTAQVVATSPGNATARHSHHRSSLHVAKRTSAERPSSPAKGWQSRHYILERERQAGSSLGGYCHCHRETRESQNDTVAVLEFACKL